MRSGADHATKRLPIDVAHVLERASERMDERADLPQRRRRAERRDFPVRIPAFQPAKSREINHRPVSCIQRREGMTRSRRAHRPCALAHRGRQINLVLGRDNLARL